jgi:hypothetical protein
MKIKETKINLKRFQKPNAKSFDELETKQN